MNNRKLIDAFKDSNLTKGKHATRVTHKQIQWCINKQKTLINVFIRSSENTCMHAPTHRFGTDMLLFFLLIYKDMK